MTNEDVASLERDTRIMYKGKIWKFKSVGKIGTRIVVKIQRGDRRFYCADPADIEIAK